MITNKDSVEPYPDRPLPSSDQSLMQQIVQHRKRAWIVLWGTTLVVCLLLGCFVFPQNYTSTVSISMQQSSMPGVIGSLLSAGGAGGTTKYLGVLKSRKFQEWVESRVHLQQLYHLPTHDDALNMIKTATRIDDNATDGLIYVEVTLGAPARFMPHTSEMREQVRQKAAEAANAFPDALGDYMDNTSTDKDSVLLRAGAKEVKITHDGYKRSMDSLMDFLKNRHMDPKIALAMGGGGSIPSPGQSDNTPGSPTDIGTPPSSTNSMPSNAGGGQQNSSVAGSRLATLYLQRTALEMQIDVAKEIRKKLQAILADPLAIVPNMPAEDPLLSNARLRYVQAKQVLDDAHLRLGPDNPQRVLAEANMKRAEASLKEQAQTMLNGNTTENVRLDGLTKQLEDVNKAIREAEHLFKGARAVTADLGRLTNDVTLNLRVYETALTNFEALKISTVSSHNRFNVVDIGEPALHSKPGLFSIVAASLAMAFVSVGIWFGIEFTLKKSRAMGPRINLLAH